MFIRDLLKNQMMFDANDGAGSGKDTKTFTQDDMDRVVKDRLARERKAWDKEQADAKKQADMTEAEKLKAAKDEAEGKVKDIQTKADQRTIKAEAKVQALAAGVKPERIDALLKLADLSSINIGEDGEPDAKALKAAVDAALKEYPEFKGTGASRSGDDFRSGNDRQPLTKEKIMAMSAAERQLHIEAIKAFYKTHKA